MDTIWFPGLDNFHFTINNVAFSIFGINVYWYGIIIATGFLLAVVLGMRASKKFGIDPDSIIDLVLIAAPVSIVTSRLYYVIFSLGEPGNPYIENPINIFKIWEGGLAFYGALIGALGTTYVYSRVKKVNVIRLFDFCLPYVALAQAIGRWGNFINQEAFGTNTSLPWGMTSETIKGYLNKVQSAGMNVNPDLPVHPAFLYESLWNFGVFFFLIWYRKRKKIDGEVFALYMILYGIGRFFVEAIRTDSLMIGPLRASQILALVFVVTFSIVLYMRRKNAAKPIVEDTDHKTSRYSSVLEKMRDEDNTDTEDRKGIKISGESQLNEDHEAALKDEDDSDRETEEKVEQQNEEINSK